MLDYIHDDDWHRKFKTMEDLRQVVKCLGELVFEFRGVKYWVDRYLVHNCETDTLECEFDNLDEFMAKGTIGGVPFKDAVSEMKLVSAPA